MSISPLALFTNRLTYVHSSLTVPWGISHHSFTDGKLRLKDVSPATYITYMSVATVFCSQPCVVFSGPELFRLIGPAIQDTAGMSSGHTSSPGPRLESTAPRCLRQPSLCFQAPLTASPFTGPVSSCPAGGVASKGGGPSGRAPAPGGWSRPPRLHLAGEAEELLSGGRGQVSVCHVFRKELIFWKPFLGTRTREAFDKHCLIQSLQRVDMRIVPVL